MRYRNAILFVLLSVVWGSAFTAIKAGLEFFPPVLFAAIRYDLAGIIMLAYAIIVVDKWLPSGRKEWILVGIGGALMIAGYHAFLFVGELQTKSAAAAVIVSLSPVLTTGFARAWLPGDQLTGLGILGLLLGLAGVIVLSEPNAAHLLGENAVGEFLVFMAALSFALGSVLAKGIDAELPIETMEAWSMVIGALLMHLVSVGIGEGVAEVSWTMEGVIALSYLSIAASAVGFLIYFDLLDRLGPVEINLVSYAAPVAAAVTGLVFLGERPTIATGGGFILILVGFFLMKRQAFRQEFAKL